MLPTKPIVIHIVFSGKQLVKGVGGIKSEKNVISFYDEGHRDLHNAYYRIKKFLIFHEDLSLRIWYFIRVNRAFQGVFLEIEFFFQSS